jgi:hypothetical protein
VTNDSVSQHCSELLTKPPDEGITMASKRRIPRRLFKYHALDGLMLDMIIAIVFVAPLATLSSKSYPAGPIIASFAVMLPVSETVGA